VRRIITNRNKVTWKPTIPIKVFRGFPHSCQACFLWRTLSLEVNSRSAGQGMSRLLWNNPKIRYRFHNSPSSWRPCDANDLLLVFLVRWKSDIPAPNTEARGSLHPRPEDFLCRGYNGPTSDGIFSDNKNGGRVTHLRTRLTHTLHTTVISISGTL
jgi:hypothetical protein